jgi:hypothetical protein
MEPIEKVLFYPYLVHSLTMSTGTSAISTVYAVALYLHQAGRGEKIVIRFIIDKK